MSERARVPRRAWIDQGLTALGDGGPDGVRVEKLARALGVTKGGFYGYFADRGALLEEMLDTWEREVTDSVIEQVESEVTDPSARARLQRLFEVVGYPGGTPTIGVAVDLAIRDWARRDAGVAERLRRVDNRHVSYLRSLLGELCADELEVEARCLVIMSIRIGDHLVVADHAGHRRAEVLERVLRRQLA
jgi:AcrR family transcriptional regulator